jgi:arabinose-5-phosphate isomerase
LIGIVSKKDSLLYKSSDIRLLIPEAKEAGGIIPTSSTTMQLALGDALAIATMKIRKFSKLDFKKIHPAGTLAAQLKTVEDLMIKGKKIPLVDLNLNITKALTILSKKKLGMLIITKKKGN